MAKRYQVHPVGNFYRVKAASTANVVIATALTVGDVVDGVTLAANDRVLLKNQTTATENGVYIAVAVDPGLRATDYAAASDAAGTVVVVTAGTANAGKAFLEYAEPAVVGTDALVYVSQPAPGKKS